VTTRKRKKGDLTRLVEALGYDPGDTAQRRPPGSMRRRESLRVPGPVSRLVRDTLIPVEPSQQFVAELGRSLMATAMRSRQSLVRRYRMAILVGAAAFGSMASVVGIIALIARRSRMRTGLS